MVNVQVTHSGNNQSRSESDVAINPTNSSNLITVSKKFIDPSKYRFTVAVLYTFDNGTTWTEVNLPIPTDWDGMTDPVLEFDNMGRAFLVVEPLRFDPSDITVTGIQVFRSNDGGKTWSEPKSLIEGRAVDGNDDKSWMASDRGNNPTTYGRMYVVWGVGQNLRFARSLDRGDTWRGLGNLQAGSDVPGINGVFAPSISVGEDGTVHVVWHARGSTTINYTRSIDGGETFESARVIVNGMVDLDSALPNAGGFPHFPNSKFRVITFATCCVLRGGQLFVAWSDMRDGIARIYYRKSNDGGQSWIGSERGEALLPTFPTNNGLYHFHPQLSKTKSGAVGCAFYEFGFKGGGYKIDTRVAQGRSFEYVTTVTDKSWDPAVNAPLSHGDEDSTFIGDYFGFDADDSSFAVVWTDTRTGVQELFYDRVSIHVTPPGDKSLVGEVVVGITNDGGGVIIVGGQILKVPPRGPVFTHIQTIIALEAAKQIEHPLGSKVVSMLAETIIATAHDIVTKHT